MVEGDSSSRPFDDAERHNNSVLLPDPPLRALTTTGATTMEMVLTADESTVDKVEPYIRVLMMIWYELAPREPRYVLNP